MTQAAEPPSVDSLLLRAAERHAARPALVFGGEALTYRELTAAVDRLADRIAADARADLRGARVAIVAGNAPCLVVALFAAWRLGAVAVPLTTRLREHELSRVLAHARPSVVVSVPTAFAFAFDELLIELLPELPSVSGALLVDAWGDVGRRLPGPNAVDPERLGAEVAAILYTSGTTGEPKGALVTHARELDGAQTLASLLGLAAEDAAAFVIPASHAFGLTCLLAGVAAGAAAVLVDSTVTTGPLLGALDERRASVLHGSPTLFAGLLKTRPGGLPGVRAGFVAGAVSPPELLERLDAAGTRLLNLYGLTEAGAVACCRFDDTGERRYTTVGRVLPTFEAATSPPRDGGGAPAELRLRGAHLVGYFDAPPDAADQFEGGWFRTGDLGEIEAGNIRIVGREKELVHVGGFNVVPAEVEQVLLQHPDVAQAVVVGVPHETMGEALHAFVVPREGSEPSPASLLAFARPKIAGYKLPYGITILPELPLLASGKPDRLALAGSTTATHVPR